MAERMDYNTDNLGEKYKDVSGDGVKSRERRKFLGFLAAGVAAGIMSTGAGGQIIEALSPKKEEQKLSYKDEKIKDSNEGLNSIDDDLKYIEKKLAETTHSSEFIDKMRSKLEVWKHRVTTLRGASLHPKNDQADVENIKNIGDFASYISSEKSKADLIC